MLLRSINRGTPGNRRDDQVGLRPSPLAVRVLDEGDKLCGRSRLDEGAKALMPFSALP